MRGMTKTTTGEEIITQKEGKQREENQLEMSLRSSPYSTQTAEG